MKSNVTLKQIAEELGLSAMTVSRAVNNRGSIDQKTKDRVIEKARSMGYTPNHIAKSLFYNKTFIIGVIVPEISHSFFPEVIRGIEEVVYNSDYQIILAHSSESPEREKKIVEMLRAKRVDGILISCSQNTTDYKFYEELAKSDTPFLFFDRCIEEIGVSYVTVNDESAAYQITKHLIKLGYKNIAHLSGTKRLSLGLNRMNGFKQALEKHNLPVRKDLIVESGFQEEGGYTAMKKILGKPKNTWPDAVFAVNDPAAFGAIDAIREKGLRIPEDIAIVGFSDDIRASLLPVPLTTVEQPAYEIGRKAADKIIRLIENKKEMNERVKIMTKLKIRSSCGNDVSARKSLAD